MTTENRDIGFLRRRAQFEQYRARTRVRSVLSQVFPRFEIRICATDVVKTTGVYIETHGVYTRISNAFYAGLIVQRSLLLSG